MREMDGYIVTRARVDDKYFVDRREYSRDASMIVIEAELTTILTGRDRYDDLLLYADVVEA